ncbi:hypothetical protein [Serpentinimonas maccroryi]|uniref:hypothetical protein n=1 Tax=Serpentinimonas maccroryi TaxID=1458426 RepID=UPI0020343F52|nr:hypothetical protein [Serpentinimonas maccroryi]MCM2479167.1 hypothetical protein [Serpentinimonas maccroryi]
MRKTFVDVLLELPVDTVLRNFLKGHGLVMPDDFAWDDTPPTSKALVDAIRAWADIPARDRLIGNLMASIQLGDGAGKQALFQAAASNGDALMGLVACQSDVHRSFWLYANHSDLFERACEFDYLERNGTRSQQHDLGVKRQPRTSDADLAGLRQAISAFYQHELQCGDGSAAYVMERSTGVFMLTVHVKDLAMLRLEFEGATLMRRVGNPNIHMVLEYAVATGVVRTLVRGGAKYHQMLVDAFSEHLLGIKVESHRIKPPTLDLSVLRLGFDVPKAVADGFTALQVKSISVLSPDTALKLDCTAMASSEQRCVTELLQAALPNEDPLARGWLVTAARINLYYPPELGKILSKVITVEVTSRGRLNLHKFDAALQAKLEGYLVDLGILQAGQTLSTQEAPPEAGTVNQQPVYED